MEYEATDSLNNHFNQCRISCSTISPFMCCNFDNFDCKTRIYLRVLERVRTDLLRMLREVDRDNRACILHNILQPILWDRTAYLRSSHTIVRIARRAKIALSAELDCICRQTTRAPLYNPLHRRRMPAHQAATNCSCEPLRSSPCDMFSSPLFLSPLSDLTRSTALPAVDLPKDPPSGCRAR
jgi:hypothetical protein